MSGWRWFWTLVGFLVFIIVLIFLYFYKPFEDLFRLVVYGLGYDNSIFWAAVVVAIVGLVGYHWRAYRVYIVAQQSVEAMVLASLRGSTFVAILLSAGATLQSVQALVVHLLQPGYELGADFGRQLVAVIALIIITAVFSIIFWLLKLMRGTGRPA
ncbi:MAG: hypothetical protein RIM84_00880 [Alphaproteobacteria bacterium]